MGPDSRCLRPHTDTPRFVHEPPARSEWLVLLSGRSSLRVSEIFVEWPLARTTGDDLPLSCSGTVPSCEGKGVLTAIEYVAHSGALADECTDEYAPGNYKPESLPSGCVAVDPKKLQAGQCSSIFAVACCLPR